MSKLRIKASHDGKSKLIEVERAGLNLAVVEKTIRESFQLPGVTLKYNHSNGTSTGLYQDFHLENAIKDAETSGARFFELQVSAGSGGGGGSQPAPAPVAAAPRAAAAPAPTPAPAAAPAQPATSNCKVCGAKGIAKFCPECGSPNDSYTAPAAAAPKPAPTPAPVAAAPAQPAYQAPAPKPAQPAYQAPAAAAAPRSGAPDHKAPPKNLGDGYCASCQGEIGLTSVSALGLSWHKECFVCIGCRKSMVESGFKNVNGWPMCADCYCDKFGLKCSACRKNITADYVQVNGQNYHKECYN